MATNNHNLLKRVLQSSVPSTVLLAEQLGQIGISRDLQQHYKRSGWLEPIGSGAFILPQDKVGWQGAVYAIQKNKGAFSMHPGALTSLSLQGMAHYMRLAKEPIYIFFHKNTLPKWFIRYNWGQKIEDYKTNFLPEKLALTKHKTQNFEIDISSAERAILECLYLTPTTIDMVECYHLIEGMSNLRPVILQELLEKCTSIKVKRLFLFMADKSKHAWVKYLDKTKINLGRGDRSLIKSGVYIKNYRIIVPEELAKNDISDL